MIINDQLQLPLGNQFEMGDGCSFVKFLLKNGADLSLLAEKEDWQKRICAAKNS